MSIEHPRVFAGKKDLVALVMLLLFSLIAWFFYCSGERQNNPLTYHVQIFTDPEKEFDMTKPPENRATLTGRLGDVEIEWDETGKVRIASSPCPCQTCVNMGWVSNSSLICVPGGIIIEPRLSSNNVDAVSR